MPLSNMRQIRKLEEMSQEERSRYLSTATRVTVVSYETVEDRKIKRVYAAKIRGVVVGNSGEWQHETPEAALQYGRDVLARWRAEYLSAASPQ